MTLSFLSAAIRAALRRRPLLIYAAAWTAILTVSVVVGSFAPEIAFVWAVTSSSSSSATACEIGAVRVPLDGPPWEAVCVPAQLFGRSKLDLVVPPVFAAAVVAGSACFVRSLGLWEAEEDSIE